MDHALVVLGMRIQAGSGRRAADAEPPEAIGRGGDALAIVAHGLGIRAELLAKTDRYGIL
jgi:hypothetical protein